MQPPRAVHRRARLRTRLVLLGVGCVVALLLAESFLRLFPGMLSENARLRLSWRSLGNPEATTLAHPRLGYVQAPGRTYQEGRAGCRFTCSTDGNGFRNSWPWPEQADVVAVGDSLTFGYGVDDPFAWTVLVEQQLQERRPDARVINLGLIGGAPLQALRAFEEYGAELSPKVLLFGVFLANDFLDERTFSGWLEAGAEGSYAMWRHQNGRRSPLRRMLNGIVDRSFLLTGLREARQDYHYDGQTVELEDGGRVQLAPGILAASVRRPAHPDFQRVLATVERARKLTEDSGVRLLVLLFPAKEEVYLPVLGEPAPDATGPFRLELEARKIDHVDVTQALQEEARKGRTLYFEVDGHPNAAGYAVMADAVLRALESRGLLQ